ncbi:MULTISPECIES: VOC family protein [Polaromonas]|uniref:VOC family protein n=1 Tax=Polaromonas aquatica TaxID=332657 RepID=A0ABW1TWT9_9BURK
MNTGAAAAPTSSVDHLVVAAASLAEGVQWCERVLGITPGPGGEHPLMGTHNRIVSIASPVFPGAYLEIIAINPGAACARPEGAKRWFDLDDRVLQASLSSHGPQLVHFVASTAHAQAGTKALARLGLDRGELLQASRMTAQGLLSWKITVREDGQRLFYGGLPTLIEWGDIHPSGSLPPSGITLQSLQASHARPEALTAAHEAIGLVNVAVVQGRPNLVATLQTPRGTVTLESKGH